MVASTKTGRAIHGVEPESQIRGRRIRGHPGHRVGRLGPRWVRIGTQFVRHLEGWYAQKHPDEDFAETFAVWLTPGSRWRLRYRGWPALINKIEYWTGVRRNVVRALVEQIEQAAGRLQLYVETANEATALVELTTYATTLAMNYLTRGSFIPGPRRPRLRSRKPGPA